MLSRMAETHGMCFFADQGLQQSQSSANVSTCKPNWQS